MTVRELGSTVQLNFQTEGEASITNEELVVKIQNGYDGYVELIDKNMGMIHERALYCKKRTTIFEYDDIVSILLFDLYRAVNYYDPRRGVRFSTVAYTFMNRTISGILRTTCRRKANGGADLVSLNSNVSTIEGETTEMIELLADDSIKDFGESMLPNDKHIMDTCIKILTERVHSKRNIEIILLQLTKQHKGVKISAELGLTKQRISAILVEGRKILREELPKHGINHWGIDWRHYETDTITIQDKLLHDNNQ